MQPEHQYDVAIIGGGLAGLAAAIQLSHKGHSVVLFEKEKYPFHKVCGEYISLESRDFLNHLGFVVEENKFPLIDTLFLSAPNGKSFTTRLPLGGFGVSRYLLDYTLADIARKNGVSLLEETRVDDVQKEGNDFMMRFVSKTVPLKSVSAKIVCAAYGKRSNMDIKWKRQFLEGHDKRWNNYVGIKYHVRTDWPGNVIGLHNFKNGYCGISQIENEQYCLCYLTKSENLRRSNNNIQEMEEIILSENPHLKRIFSESEIMDSFPVVISQISFGNKTQTEKNILMLGDAAGMITPLCGNGMSIALHTSKIAAGLIHEFLTGKISRAQLEYSYSQQWKHFFATRLQTGRILQRFFGSRTLSNLFVSSFRIFPILAAPVVKMTHGKPF